MKTCVLFSEIENLLRSQPDRWALRFTPFWHYRRRENNVFSLASALFILQDLAPHLSAELRTKTAEIRQQIQHQYPRFRNKDGRATYNFYPTRPSGHFPNGLFMQHLDHFRLPDDIDDTALITYTLNPAREEVLALRELTAGFAEDLPCGKQVYNTWYGKNMPKEQDVCALLNLLYLFSAYQLPPSRTDRDTFTFLGEQVEKILTHPFDIARHYASPALILYHYCRFMSRFRSPLDPLQPLIRRTALEVAASEKVFMNRLILESSLLRMGEKRPLLDLRRATSKGFHTFIGAPFAPFSPPWVKRWAALPAYQIFWRSELHEKALLAEYLVLSRLSSEK